jgi:hypothetical protein
MFYNPGSRADRGSRGFVAGRAGQIGDFYMLGPSARAYLQIGLTGAVTPPRVFAAYALNILQGNNYGGVTGVAETNTAVTNAQNLRPAGIYGLGFGSPPAGVAVGTIRGGDFDGIFNGAGSALLVTGSFHYAEVQAGTVTTASAIKTVGPFLSGGTLTNAYGIWISPLTSVTGTTNAAALQIDSFTGPTNNWSIKTGNNLAEFGANVLVDGDLIVNGGRTQRTSLFGGHSAFEFNGRGPFSTVFTFWEWSATTTNGAGLYILKSANDTVGTAASLTNGEQIGGFIFGGYDAAGTPALQESARVICKVDAAVAAASIPGRLEFWTVASGQQFANFNMGLDNAGRLGIGNSPAPAHWLDILRAGTTTIAPLRLASGTNLTTAAAGAIEFDGKAFYATSVASARQIVNAEQIQALTTTRTFTNNTSAQAIFNATANGAVTLAAATTYEFEMSVTASGFSSSAHTINLSFGGTATFTSIGYYYNSQTGSTLAGPTADLSGWIAAATATAIIASTTTTGLQLYVRGIMRISGAGTVIPQLTQVTASAAAIVQANSFFRCWPIGSDTVASVGNWS